MKQFLLVASVIALACLAGAAGFILTPPMPEYHPAPAKKIGYCGYGSSGPVVIEYVPVFTFAAPKPHEDPGIMTYVDGDWPDWTKRPSQPSLSREGAGSMERVEEGVTAKVGETIELDSPTFPVTPKFQGARVTVKLAGDRVLEVVGQASIAGEAEGKARCAAFFLVKGAGTTTVHLSLVDEAGKPIEGYDADCTVTSKR